MPNMGGGQPPVKSEVRAQSNKVGRLWFFGGRCSRISRGTPEARSHLCICRASFFMTFVTSGMPHRLPALRYADDTTLMAESEEELKSFLMKVKEESEKAGLKLNIQKTMIMTSGT